LHPSGTNLLIQYTGMVLLWSNIATAAFQHDRVKNPESQPKK
jgi:hypothetical protein